MTTITYDATSFDGLSFEAAEPETDGAAVANFFRTLNGRGTVRSLRV